MSTSSVSLGSNLYQTSTQSTANQERQSFKQLASSLQSGDLSGAQKAFSTLQNLLSSNQSGSQNSPIKNDLTALGQALSSGDISTAQSDFSQLQTDLQSSAQSGASGSGQAVQSAHHGGHHHHHASSASSSDASAADASTDTSAASTSDADTSSTGSTVSVYA